MTDTLLYQLFSVEPSPRDLDWAPDSSYLKLAYDRLIDRLKPSHCSHTDAALASQVVSCAYYLLCDLDRELAYRLYGLSGVEFPFDREEICRALEVVDIIRLSQPRSIEEPIVSSSVSIPLEWVLQDSPVNHPKEWPLSSLSSSQPESCEDYKEGPLWEFTKELCSRIASEESPSIESSGLAHSNPEVGSPPETVKRSSSISLDDPGQPPSRVPSPLLSPSSVSTSSSSVSVHFDGLGVSPRSPVDSQVSPRVDGAQDSADSVEVDQRINIKPLIKPDPSEVVQEASSPVELSSSQNGGAVDASVPCSSVGSPSLVKEEPRDAINPLPSHRSTEGAQCVTSKEVPELIVIGDDDDNSDCSTSEKRDKDTNCKGESGNSSEASVPLEDVFGEHYRKSLDLSPSGPRAYSGNRFVGYIASSRSSSDSCLPTTSASSLSPLPSSSRPYLGPFDGSEPSKPRTRLRSGLRIGRSTSYPSNNSSSPPLSSRTRSNTRRFSGPSISSRYAPYRLPSRRRIIKVLDHETRRSTLKFLVRFNNVVEGWVFPEEMEEHPEILQSYLMQLRTCSRRRYLYLIAKYDFLRELFEEYI